MQNNFEKILNEVVDDTLKEIFTEPATEIIYQHLGVNYGLKPEDIAENIDTFKKGLEAFLSSGAQVVESVVIKRLHKRLKLKLENKENLTFTDHIKTLKQQAENK
jgi:tRNA(His) 5'-end guanylyltransferase